MKHNLILVSDGNNHFISGESKLHGKLSFTTQSLGKLAKSTYAERLIPGLMAELIKNGFE